MSKLLKISVLLLLFFLPLSAVGMEGVVVYYRFGCDYYIIYTEIGYALIESQVGGDIGDYDVLIGNFNSRGLTIIHNVTRGYDCKVWIEGYGMTEEDVNYGYHSKCYN